MLLNRDDVLGEINPDEIVWRYMSLAKFVSMLNSRSLWLSSLVTMADPYEGFVSPLPYIQYIQEQQPQGGEFKYPEWFEAFLRAGDINWTNITLTYANCWNVWKSEADLLWRIYGNDGIAVQSTVGKLKDAAGADASLELIIGKVTYVDNIERPDARFEGELAAFRKRDFFGL